jgi:hypothetical protein
MAKGKPKSKGKAAKAAPRPTRAAMRKGAFAAGVAAAEVALKRQKAKVRVAAAGPPKGLLVAEGDSWFDYPLSDVLAELEDLRWEIVSVAHHGDTVESMAYDGPQFSRLERELRRLKAANRQPKAILLSGGGNDIAGEEFAMLLNHVASGLPPLNEKVLEGLFEERLESALVSLAAGVTHLSVALYGKKLPILLHGYAYPVPDGRGFLGGWGFLPGPWLEPGFRRKGYDPKVEAELQRMTALMKVLIDRFNTLLAGIAGSPNLGHVVYVDLRATLTNALPKKYKEDWGNELHPTANGFEAVARRFDAALAGLG